MKFCLPVEEIDDSYMTMVVENTKYDTVETNKTKFNVLLVDDSPLNIKISSRLLSKLFPKAEIITAIDGQDALEKCNVQKNSGLEIDLLFTDYHMPRISGDVLVGKVKPIFEGSKCIVYTADVSQKTKRYLLSSGADAVLVKPTSKNELFDAICSLLKL